MQKLPDNIVSEYRLRSEAARENLLNSIPKVKLGFENMKNCQLLLDRSHLLKLLPKGGVVAEVGVNKGEFSKEILDVCKPKKFHLIDAWHTERYHESLSLFVEEKFATEITTNQIEINRGLSTDVVEQFPDQYFDWVYLDTSHDYTTTKLELEKYSKKMKEGGIIAGHDYTMGNWLKTYKYGVIEAVHEFCVNKQWELVFLTTDYIENQSFAIRKL